jgi:hypothetical protein
MAEKKIDKIDTLVPIHSPDKTFQEKWSKGRNLMNIPSSFRCCIFGKPGVGKTSFIKNMLIHQNPCFNGIYVIAAGGNNDSEYNDVKAMKLKKIPEVKDFPGRNVKSVLIIDDGQFINMKSDEEERLNTLVGYGSSHCNISFICSVQRLTIVPVFVRSCCDIFVLFQNNNLNDIALIAPRICMKVAELTKLMDKYIKDPHDSIMVDLTPGSPAKFRLNGYTKLSI